MANLNDGQVLDYLNAAQDNMEGFEDLNAQTMSIPFIKLAQDLTPEVKKSKDVYIEGLEPGMFFNTATKEILGDKFQFVVLKFERIYIEWLPDRGGFVGYHSPENAEKLATDKTFGKWTMANGNALQEYYTYFGIVIGHEKEGPVVLSLTSSAIKQAKNLNRLMSTHIMDNGQRALPYYLVWDTEALHMEKDGNDWFVPTFKYAGYITEEVYKIVGQERKMLPEKPVDYAQLEDKSEQYDDSDL